MAVKISSFLTSNRMEKIRCYGLPLKEVRYVFSIQQRLDDSDIDGTACRQHFFVLYGFCFDLCRLWRIRRKIDIAFCAPGEFRPIFRPTHRTKHSAQFPFLRLTVTEPLKVARFDCWFAPCRHREHGSALADWFGYKVVFLRAIISKRAIPSNRMEDGSGIGVVL